jgi:putative hydroxymethylpyrimidine transport system permease protein
VRRARPVAAGALAPVLLALGLLAGWETYARLGGVDAFLLPAPSRIAQALWDDRGLLWDNFAVTAAEVLLGIGVALVAGLACATALHFSRLVRRTTYPLLVASQTIPIVIVAPLLVVWLGYDLAPKLAIIGLICFFPVTVTALDGLASVDPDLRKLMHTLGASRLQAFRRVEAPAALPAALSGAKIAVAVAVIGAVLAEQAGSSQGLGHLILQAIPQFETARAYAAVVVLSAFAIALFGALSLAERALLPWAHRRRGGTE